MTVMISTAVAELLPESVTSTVMLAVLAAPDGVPEMVPVEEVRVSPAGSDPPEIAHVYPAPVPPVAVRAAE